MLNAPSHEHLRKLLKEVDSISLKMCFPVYILQKPKGINVDLQYCFYVLRAVDKDKLGDFYCKLAEEKATFGQLFESLKKELL